MERRRQRNGGEGGRNKGEEGGNSRTTGTRCGYLNRLLMRVVSFLLNSFTIQKNTRIMSILLVAMVTTIPFLLRRGEGIYIL